MNEPSDELKEEFLKRLMNISYNKKCADCGSPQPSWASLTYSFFICYNCAALHRSLGVLKSKTKSTQMDKWSIEDLRRMYIGGNKNITKLEESTDFSERYADTDDFIAALNALVKKSEKEEPGIKFMEIDKKNQKHSQFKGVVTKTAKSKFSDVIDSESSEEQNVELKNVVDSESDVEEEVLVKVHKGKVTDKPTRNLEKSRSPFSFGVSKVEESDSE